LKQLFGLVEICDIVELDVGVFVNYISFKRSDEVGIGSLAIWVMAQQELAVFFATRRFGVI